MVSSGAEEEEFDPQVALEVINSQNALSRARNDGLRFSYLQATMRTDFGHEIFMAGVEAFWRRIIADPGAFSPEVSQLFLQPNLTAFRLRRNGELKRSPTWTMVEVTSDTVDVVPFLQRELASIGIAMNPSKTVAVSHHDSHRLHGATNSLHRASDGFGVSLPACQKADNSALWTLENLLDLSGTAKESPFFEDERPTSELMLLPHQRAKGSLSPGAGGFGLSSAERRRMSASVGSMVAAVPEVLADLSGILGENVRMGLSDSDLVRSIWRSVRDLHDVHGVSEDVMANIVPKSWRDRTELSD